MRFIIQLNPIDCRTRHFALSLRIDRHTIAVPRPPTRSPKVHANRARATCGRRLDRSLPAASLCRLLFLMPKEKRCQCSPWRPGSERWSCRTPRSRCCRVARGPVHASASARIAWPYLVCRAWRYCRSIGPFQVVISRKRLGIVIESGWKPLAMRVCQRIF